jgi:hypothetical protein
MYYKISVILLLPQRPTRTTTGSITQQCQHFATQKHVKPTLSHFDDIAPSSSILHPLHREETSTDNDSFVMGPKACSAPRCSKYRQFGNNGLCRKHFLQIGFEYSNNDSDSNNDNDDEVSQLVAINNNDGEELHPLQQAGVDDGGNHDFSDDNSLRMEEGEIVGNAGPHLPPPVVALGREGLDGLVANENSSNVNDDFSFSSNQNSFHTSHSDNEMYDAQDEVVGQ